MPGQESPCSFRRFGTEGRVFRVQESPCSFRHFGTEGRVFRVYGLWFRVQDLRFES